MIINRIYSVLSWMKTNQFLKPKTNLTHQTISFSPEHDRKPFSQTSDVLSISRLCASNKQYLTAQCGLLKATNNVFLTRNLVKYSNKKYIFSHLFLFINT